MVLIVHIYSLCNQINYLLKPLKINNKKEDFFHFKTSKSFLFTRSERVNSFDLKEWNNDAADAFADTDDDECLLFSSIHESRYT
jgi:hypothetical protein